MDIYSKRGTGYEHYGTISSVMKMNEVCKKCHKK